MRIACPACTAEYDVPDGVVAAGRKVRCARCQEVWTVPPPDALAPAAADPRAPEPATAHSGVESGAASPGAPTSVPTSVPPAAPPRFPSVAPPRADERPYDRLPGEQEAEEDDDPATDRAAPVWVLAWAASLLVVALGGWSAWHWHAAVIEAWPASVRLYAALGLAGH